MRNNNRQASIRISRLNDCLLSFTPYPMENVRRLTALCGELLLASHAYYSWLDNGVLYTPGVWQAPSAKRRRGPQRGKKRLCPDYNAIDRPEGRIAYEVIQGSSGVLTLIPNLADTPYMQTDPLVANSGAHTFAGRGVQGGGKTTGCLAVLFRDERGLSVDDVQFLTIVATAIAVEERRKWLETDREKLLQKTMEANEKLEQEIRDRVRAESELQFFSKQLAQRNEELKTFAYIVSHDLKAPLINLRGFAQELRRDLRQLHQMLDDSSSEGRLILERDRYAEVSRILQEDMEESLGYMESSEARMDALLSAILTLSRIGRQELVVERIDMNALMRDVLSSMAHQIEMKNAEITVGDLPVVQADYLSMTQIMGNLLDNAIKYLTGLRPGKIEVTAAETKTEVTFQVRDNGRGIIEADHDRIFEIFQRSGELDIPGEGMGLAYVRTIVRRHGGEITCSSTPGAGAAFSFTLPKCIAESIRQEPV